MDRRGQTPMRVSCLIAAILAFHAPALAHPAPFSYLDLRLDAERIEGALTAHTIDVAHELGLAGPDSLLDVRVATEHRARIVDALWPMFSVALDGAVARGEPGTLEVLADRQALRLHFAVATDGSVGVLEVVGRLFSYDPNHQTFVNVYESGELVHQAILSRDRVTARHFTGTRQGLGAVVRWFVASGIEHIVIGPDHILFLMGLLLLGGGAWVLAGIVTAFTLAHSITLTVAALGIVSIPARLVEPAIALSIVYVGADNLLVSKDGRDVRTWIAFGFGLIHGFGFASVLREVGLPDQALGWSLASFNLGVEIGQLAIVVVAVAVLTGVRRWNESLAERIVVVGSVGVILAGAYWFVERVFLTGGL